jgi:hypothetical protein
MTMTENEVLPPVKFSPPTTRAGLKKFIEQCLLGRSMTDYENTPSECDTDWGD